MGRFYAVMEGTRERVLHHIQCDCCDATVKPHPDIKNSGWMKAGGDDGPGTDKWDKDFCPTHAYLAP